MGAPSLKHPDRLTWYVAAVASIPVAVALAAGICFLTVAAPIYVGGKDLEMSWPWIGIPLGALLGLLSLSSLAVIPGWLYRLFGGRSE
jgi:hypothetical protein